MQSVNRFFLNLNTTNWATPCILTLNALQNIRGMFEGVTCRFEMHAIILR